MLTFYDTKNKTMLITNDNKIKDYAVKLLHDDLNKRGINIYEIKFKEVENPYKGLGSSTLYAIMNHEAAMSAYMKLLKHFGVKYGVYCELL